MVGPETRDGWMIREMDVKEYLSKMEVRALSAHQDSLDASTVGDQGTPRSVSR
jgi:hypothetical protein